MKKIPLKAIRTGTPSVQAYVRAASQHVTPIHGEWQVKKAGASRATKICSTQQEALEMARTLALHQQAELFIHGRNGRIRERNSYGNDSFPPRG